VAFIGEFYADLDYGPDGFLIITREHHAVEPAEAAGRVLRAMNEGKVRATNGQDFSVRAQSVCVHSDTPGALAVAKAVHEALRPGPV
jgi:5-oxoprolinase (ATP-hydrolysing) subunit A